MAAASHIAGTWDTAGTGPPCPDASMTLFSDDDSDVAFDRDARAERRRERLQALSSPAR
jgi:hypothetical protein